MTDDRYTLAINIMGALLLRLPGAKISIRKTTSDCPIVRVDLGKGDVFNLTITRARS
jgi:hypothetical protein